LAPGVKVTKSCQCHSKGRAVFTAGALFSSAELSGKADFHSAKFSEAKFSSAEFSEGYFSSAEFSEGYFSSAEFSGKADLMGAKFSGEANFSCEFDSKTSFNDVLFEDGKNIHWVNITVALFKSGLAISMVE
jgi:uncharacterized protein YjbI with pentapeptide repeats